jgi:acetyl-CoA carboxylase alpha subunit
MAERLKSTILKELADLSSLDSSELIDRRIAKYDRIGIWEE